MFGMTGNIPYWFLSNNNSVSLYSSVRIARNFKFINFPSTGEYNSFRQVEKRAEIILESLLEEGIVEFYDLSLIDPDELKRLQKFRILPETRNEILSNMKLYYHKDLRSFLLTNYTDHLTFFSHFGGTEIQKAYESCSLFAGMFDRTDLSIDENGNYYTSLLDYFGTGLKCFSVLTIPVLRISDSYKTVISSLALNMIDKKDYFSIEDNDFIVITNRDSLSKDRDEIISNFKKILDELAAVSEKILDENVGKIEILRQKCKKIINYDTLTFKDFIEIYNILSFFRMKRLSKISISELNEQLVKQIINSSKSLHLNEEFRNRVIKDLTENDAKNLIK